MKQLLQILAILTGVSGFTGVAGAQTADDRRIEVHVTAVVAANVYIDAGRDAGIEPGDRVRFFPVDRATFETQVVSVSRGGARVELDASATVLRIGDRGVCFVPAERVTEGADTSPLVPDTAHQGGVPGRAGEAEARDHPPWESGEVEWDTDVPLLAPIQTRMPQERASRFSGRFTTLLQNTWDEENDSSYLVARAGLELTYENPFGRADYFEFRADSDYRRSDVEFGGSEEETNVRIERLSYGFGGGRAGPDRWEFGRFLQNRFPEFGIIDGAEFTRRTDQGHRFGLSLGLQPEPNDEMKVDGDVQVAVFGEWVSGPDETVVVAGGLQKTWHEGKSDRDLLVLRVDAAVYENATVNGTLWVDHYGSSDTDRSTIELTQALINARWHDGTGTGAGLTFSQLRWPELLRDEFAPLTAERLEESEVTRVGANAWTRVGRNWRFALRGDLWEDEDDSGSSFDLRVTARELLWEHGDIGLSIYTNQAEFQDANGVRISGSRQIARGFLTASFDTVFVQRPGLATGDEDFTNQAFRASYDRGLFENWNASFFIERRFGDEQDSLTTGFSLSRSF